MIQLRIGENNKEMVFINVMKENPIVLECHKNKEDGDSFRLVIDPKTKEIIEKPMTNNLQAICLFKKLGRNSRL